jgi:hypothetical protein
MYWIILDDQGCCQVDLQDCATHACLNLRHHRKSKSLVDWRPDRDSRAHSLRLSRLFRPVQTPKVETSVPTQAIIDDFST